MSEEWKDIPGFEGKYQASTLGNVRSIDRYFGARFIPGVNLKLHMCNSGYLRAFLAIGGRKLKAFTVHRLVALTFIGKGGDLVVNHKDGVKTNNQLENLEWVTLSENHRHAFSLGLSKMPRGEDNPGAKVKESQVIYAKQLLEFHFTSKQISEMTGIPSGNLSNIKRGKSWTHITLE